MYKNLCVAILLFATFVFTSGSKPADASPTGPSSPVIVATVKLTGQTAPISSTTLFTPTATGVYRVSAYMTQVTPVNLLNVFWYLNLRWRDDAGAESAAVETNNPVLQTLTSGAPPNAYGFDGIPPGSTSIIEAKAGQPITYSVVLSAGTSGGTYSLFMVVERLE
ncbi:MAG TPA: hypothetical protein VNX26_07190 [Candidatus Acidoferrum sp.]|nr:hypothetical protein [Candidatus Acidoferrum sp.]